MGVKYCYDYSMNKIIVLFVIVIAVSGCAPKLLGVSENPPKIYIQVPKMAHPEAPLSRIQLFWLGASILN